jgi:hypothetical protein
MGQQHREGDRRRRRVEGLGLLDVRLPLAQFRGGLPLVAAQFGDQRDHAGGESLVESPSDSQPFCWPRRRPPSSRGSDLMRLRLVLELRSAARRKTCSSNPLRGRAQP